MRNDGNLLGTIKSLDLLGVQTLNCTENAGQKVHDVRIVLKKALSKPCRFSFPVNARPHAQSFPRLRTPAASGIAPLRVGPRLARRLGHPQRH